MSAFNKYVLSVAMVLLCGTLQSCFQFRMSDKKQKNELAEVSETYNVELGVKGGAGRSIHYTLVHSDSALPLAVFIHGSPGSSSNYIQFAQDTTLLARYNVLLIDRPGYGYSGFGNAEKSIEQQSKILREVVSQFPYARKYLVGHSLGGPIVCRMAMDEPSLPAGLLIIAGSVSPDLEPQEKWRKPLSRKAIRWLLPRSFRVSNDEILPAKQELINMAPLWPKIKCDVQIIQGGQDNLVPSGNEDYAEKMLVNAKSVRVYRLPEEDHFIPFSHPGIVTEKLLLF